MSLNLDQNNTGEWTKTKLRTVAHQYTTGGWTCAFCNAFISYGREHWCSGKPNHFSQPEYLPQWHPTPVQVTYPDPMLIEIRDLLKRLIALLEGR